MVDFMKTVFLGKLKSYKGLTGTIELETRTNRLMGYIEKVPENCIYSGKDIKSLYKNFCREVDEYLDCVKNEDILSEEEIASIVGFNVCIYEISDFIKIINESSGLDTFGEKFFFDDRTRCLIKFDTLDSYTIELCSKNMGYRYIICDN